MAVMILSVVMDALANACIPNVAKNAYAWPVESVNPPCVVVGYPDEIEFDYTFGRGSDKAIFPVYYITGRTSDRTTRDELSRAIVGVDGVKDALDGDLDGAVQTSTVEKCSITRISVNSIEYMALQFDVTIIS